MLATLPQLTTMQAKHDFVVLKSRFDIVLGMRLECVLGMMLRVYQLVIRATLSLYSVACRDG